MRKSIGLSISAALALMTVNAVGAEGYAKGHGALEVFDADGIAASPQWVQAWIAFMLLTFAIGLFVFAWKQPLARWAAGGFIVSAGAGAIVFQALGLPFLSGSIAIMHLVCWMPALILLLIKRPFLNPEEGRWFRTWSGMMTAVILFSFVFDIRDAFVYLSHFS